MNKEHLEKLSRFLSLILRHKPEVIGATIDKKGWINVNDILTGMHIDKDTLDKIVDTDSKGRYEYNDSGDKIRAVQGHSLDVDVDLEEKEPPEVLYHGTAAKYMISIENIGLIPQSRKYVHLSADTVTASKVGARHGKPIVLEIAAKEMFNSGCKFYLSRNGIWLTDSVKPKYLKIYRGY